MKENFGLYLILTDPVTGYETCAQAAVNCGVRYLQLRMKNAPRETVIKTARAILAITKHSQTRLIINDDLSVAIETNADGIHLGQDDLALPEARAQWNHPGKLFGLSTHNNAQAIDAEILKPDYIGIGPVFATPTKADAGPALGPDKTAALATSTPLTSVAIGGINGDNLPALLQKGVRNFCVVRAVNKASDPTAAIRHLQQIYKNFVF